MGRPFSVWLLYCLLILKKTSIHVRIKIAGSFISEEKEKLLTFALLRRRRDSFPNLSIKTCRGTEISWWDGPREIDSMNKRHLYVLGNVWSWRSTTPEIRDKLSINTKKTLFIPIFNCSSTFHYLPL